MDAHVHDHIHILVPFLHFPAIITMYHLSLAGVSLLMYKISMLPESSPQVAEAAADLEELVCKVAAFSMSMELFDPDKKKVWFEMVQEAMRKDPGLQDAAASEVRVMEYRKADTGCITVQWLFVVLHGCLTCVVTLQRAHVTSRLCTTHDGHVLI
jgi:hypothetical protein